MQFNYKINDAHMRFITGVGYNPVRHELITGSEDGIVKFWEVETGGLLAAVQVHQGWVTSFLFWKNAKMVLSASHDCTISIWQGYAVLQIIHLEEPIYKMCLDMSGEILLCGSSTGLDIYNLYKEKFEGYFLDVESRTHMKEHTEIVRCIVSIDNRVYSAGFDQKLVIYDCLYYGSEFLKVSAVIEEAHEAAITCLCAIKDNDNSIWIITGSFDKCVKIWNNTGKLLHRLAVFSTSIVDVCVIDKSKLLWVSSGGPTPLIFDIRSGEDVTQYSNCFQKIESERIMLQLVRYLPDAGIVVATTSRRQIFTWRWQTSSAVSRLMCGMTIDCICLCEKSPILIFCAGGNGQIILWENRESNDATYQQDITKLARSMQSAVDIKMQSRQFQLEASYSKHRQTQKQEARRNKTGKRFLQMLYLDSTDLLIAASEDGVIYVFGYDTVAVEALLAVTKVPSPDSKWIKAKTRINAMKAFRSSNECLLELKVDVDPITMRITGLSCIHVLLEHKNVVSSIAIVPPGHGRDECYLVSCGWDQRICVWSLETFELVTKWQSTSHTDRELRELAAEDAIICVAYSNKHDQIAYASVDMIVHIMQFNTVGSKMTLVHRLSDFDGDITSIIWAESLGFWITSSEDHTIRLWESDGSFKCVQLINSGGPVSKILYDEFNDVIIAAVGNKIKIFDIIEERIVQVNCGHADDIKGIINLPNKNQFASVGDDGQLLFWSNWTRPKKYAGSAFTEEN